MDRLRSPPPPHPCIPFLLTIMSFFLSFFVPVLCVTCLLTLGILSFWPVVVMSLPFLVGGAALAMLLLLGAVATLTLFPSLRAALIRFVSSRIFFLMPFHAIFITAAVSVYSLFWSFLIGACLFVQSEVLFPHAAPSSSYSPDSGRWNACVELCERWSWAIFDYFPINVVMDSGSKGSLFSNSSSSGSNNGSQQTDPISSSDDDEARSNDNLDYKIDNQSRQTSASTDDAPKIYCYHPHGVYAIGLFSLVFGKASGFSRLISPFRGNSQMVKSTGTKQRPLLVGVASALLHLPILGRLCSWFGFVPASRDSLDMVCKSDCDLALVPGGIAEMTLPCGRDVERLYLNRRRGFVRLALKHGRPLIPVYCFGETQIFHQYDWFQSTRHWLSRKFRVSIVFFRGRNCTLIPRRVPLRVVVGSPLAVPRVANPSQELVDRVHREYVERLRELFERHKRLHPGYENARLELH